MKPFKTVTADAAEKLIADANPLILDCRELKDYRAGHIDNAMHVHEQLRDSLIKKGDKARDMLIYCYFGHASEGEARINTEESAALRWYSSAELDQPEIAPDIRILGRQAIAALAHFSQG